MTDNINIHGQQDNQNLLNSAKHIYYLDDFIGNKILDLKLEYAELFNRYNEINAELKKNYGDDKEKERRIFSSSFEYCPGRKRFCEGFSEGLDSYYVYQKK